MCVCERQNATPPPPRRSRNISGTADAETEGEGEGGAVFTARPRDINTGNAPSEREAGEEGRGAPPIDFARLGPKGLALPAWHPSMEQV